MNPNVILKNRGPYKVSVVIPVYNVEQYIADTIRSVLNQTLKQVQIILVNDGSTDRSEEIIRDFAEQHDSLVYVKQENLGPGAARNKGIELATGQFVCFVDSDDLLPEKALETMYSTALKEKADLITGASISFSMKRNWFIESHAHNGVYNAGPKKLVTHPELLYSVGPCNKMFKRELIQNIRFPEGIQVTEDHPFIIEAYLRAKQIFTVDKVIYQYRRREAGENLSLSQSVRFNAANVLRDIMKSVTLTDRLWDLHLDQEKRLNLKTYYYHRLIIADIWPALINTFRNQPHPNRREIVQKVCDWANQMEPSVIEALKKLGSGKKVTALKMASRMRSLQPLKNRILVDRCYKVNRLYRKKLQDYIGMKVVYPVLKRRNLENKIVYISNKITSVAFYDEILKESLKRRWPAHEIKIWLLNSEFPRDSFRYFYDLATAQIVIFDDYSNPYLVIKNRVQTLVLERNHVDELNEQWNGEVQQLGWTD